MAFTDVIAYAGSSGQLKNVVVAYSATTDIVVNASPATAIVYSISGWNLEASAENGDIKVFDNPADATTGVIYGVELRGGVGKWKGSCEGVLDGGSVVSSKIPLITPGVFFVADFLFKKAGLGFKSCLIRVTSGGTGAMVDKSPDAVKFSFNVSGDIGGIS